MWCRRLLGLLGLTPSLVFGSPNASLTWSPDGRWLAYTVSSPVSPDLPPPGWLVEPGPPDVPLADPNEARADGPRVCRIFAANPATGESVLLEESRGALTAPEWAPDGHSLAFARVVPEAAGGFRVDLVIQEGPGRQRVLLTRQVDGPAPDPDRVASQVVAWGPDGRYLAVPDFEAVPGLNVVRADNGRLLKTILAAVWPAWSPDGSKLAFVGTGKDESLQLMETNFGPARPRFELGRTYQPPFWSRDGKSILAVASRASDRGRGLGTQQLDLLRIPVESGSVETVTHLASGPAGQGAARAVSFGIDRDGEDLFSTAPLDGQPATILWLRPRTRAPIDRFNPIDPMLTAGSLSLSPNGQGLAMRFGGHVAGATAGVWLPASKQWVPLVPDERARRDWVALLVAVGRKLLQVSLPRPVVRGQPVERLSTLPVVGELSPSTDLPFRLRRIGRLGRPLCDPSAGAPVDDPDLARFLAEARLFFDALQGDPTAALASLDALEAHTESADRRLRLLALRAQLLVNSGELEKARDTVHYLESVEGLGVSRFEVTQAGVTLTPEPSATRGWAGYLAIRLDEAARSRRLPGSTPGVGTDPLNPEELPALPPPFARAPNGVFPRQFPAGAPEAPDVRVRIRRPRRFPNPPPRTPFSR